MVEFATLTESHLEPLRQELIAKASANVDAFPQYRTHFKDYVLVRVRKDIKTKMGLAFVKGEITIAHPNDSLSCMFDKRFYTVWSFKNDVDTAVAGPDLEFL